MDLSNKPKHGVLYAEPLEGRWLLSGAGSLDNGSPPPRQHLAIDLLELSPASEEDGDVPIAPTSLPRAVLAAIEADFPGADLIGAELETEQGETEYDVTARHNGQEMDITLTPSGTIIETETIVPPEALPQEVLDWLHGEYPGAAIDEAAIVNQSGRVTYEVSFEQPGSDALEATLGIRDVQSPDSPDKGVNQVVLDRAELTSHSTSDATSSDSEVQLASELPSPDHPDASPTSSGDARGSTEAAQAQNSEPAASPALDDAEAAALFRDSIWNNDLEPISESLKLLAAGAGAGVWLPEAADVLSNVFSFNAAAVEQGLDRVLDGIDALAQQVVGETSATTTPAQIAAVAVVLTGTHLVARQSGRRKRGPLLAVKAEDTSWSWVVGSASQAHNERLLLK